MMDLFFTDPKDVPQPPENIEIRQLSAKPFPDGKRVAVEFELTPFQQRPNIEIGVTNQEGRVVSSFSVVEAIENKMSFTLHLREPNPHGAYLVDMQVFYTDMAELEEESEQLIKEILLENKRTIATSQIHFEIQT